MVLRSFLTALARARPVNLACLAVVLLATVFVSAEPRCSRAAASPEIFEVEEFVDLLAPRLQRTLTRWRGARAAKNSPAVIHEDPSACRFCNGAQMWLLRFLKLHFPQHSFRSVRTRDPVQRGYYHDYIYSPILNLMIDPTYRQFLTGMDADEFAKLPRTFIGSPDEFRERMRPHASAALVERILLTYWFML